MIRVVIDLTIDPSEPADASRIALVEDAKASLLNAAAAVGVVSVRTATVTDAPLPGEAGHAAWAQAEADRGFAGDDVDGVARVVE